MTDCQLCGLPLRLIREEPFYPNGPQPYVPGQRPSPYGPEVEIHRTWACPNLHQWRQTPQGMHEDTAERQEQP